MRCYDGCPDSELQAKMDADARIRNRLRKRGLRVVYFPMEGKYMVFDEHHNAKTGFHDNLDAIAEKLLITEPRCV